jgi:hypothetical protein
MSMVTFVHFPKNTPMNMAFSTAFLKNFEKFRVKRQSKLSVPNIPNKFILINKYFTYLCYYPILF